MIALPTYIFPVTRLMMMYTPASGLIHSLTTALAPSMCRSSKTALGCRLGELRMASHRGDRVSGSTEREDRLYPYGNRLVVSYHAPKTLFFINNSNS